MCNFRNLKSLNIIFSTKLELIIYIFNSNRELVNSTSSNLSLTLILSDIGQIIFIKIIDDV